MGPRALLLTALLAAGLAAGCDTGGAAPDPVPSPSPTSAPNPTGAPTTTGSPVPTDENCPPPAGLTEQLEIIALRNSIRLPDGGRIGFAEWKGDTVVLEVVRATPGCPTDAVPLELQQRGGGTVRGLKIDVVSVNGPGTGGSVPTVQIRYGPYG